MLHTRVCALTECEEEFQTDNPRKTYCSRQHSTLDRMRRYRKNHRKGKGGGGGGGNGGGGGSPTLFDTLTPQDSRAIYVPDTCYRTPKQEPARKPAVRITEESSKVAA
jgi:hypothetical protein